MGTIRRGVVSLNYHAGQYRIAPERHAGCPPDRHGRALREGAL
jgi:hypothetical protein